jgi:hypothetical protein
MHPHPRNRRPLEPLTLARPLALVLAAVVTVSAGLAWGVSGTLAALCGSALSLINVAVLQRMAVRAARQVEVTGAVGTAASGLQAVLAAKTVVLLTVVALLSGSVGHGRLSTPFGLGLLVSVFALILAGLVAAARDQEGNN